MIGAGFPRSVELLERALKTIPTGTQTFSKSTSQFPIGLAPQFAQRAEGCRLWDVDGNEFVDFVSGLLAILLGYRDPDVDGAVRAQLELGVTFSLPHPVEIEVAERIVEMVPCAEMVRFGKNGSDATAGCVRVARAFTRRDRIVVCGYHGWQDWYIGSTTRDAGVPAATRELTHKFVYNDLASLQELFERYPDDIAAVIMEPMNVAYPAPGFLEGVRDVTREHGALLVFDEIITGFRFARGGAQELFGVVPDLVALGKGFANGFPLSAVAGRADVMRSMEEVFFSFTMGSEALSLAAAAATLRKISDTPVLESIAARGTRLKDGLQALVRKHGAESFLECSGHPAWSFFVIRDTEEYGALEIKTLWMQEFIARGILSVGTHNLSYAHGDGEIDRLLEAYDEVIPMLREAVENRSLRQRLRSAPLQPVFRVR